MKPNKSAVHRGVRALVADLLKVPPDVNVAHVDANTCAVSMRDLNDRLDRLLSLLMQITAKCPRTE